jgi:hypothetical protein
MTNETSRPTRAQIAELALAIAGECEFIAFGRTLDPIAVAKRIHDNADTLVAWLEQ